MLTIASTSQGAVWVPLSRDQAQMSSQRSGSGAKPLLPRWFESALNHSQMWAASSGSSGPASIWAWAFLLPCFAALARFAASVDPSGSGADRSK